jgi:hypothetical protein
MNGEMYPKQFFPLDGVILNEVKDPVFVFAFLQ